jgi:arginine-tRNA-protein transferase
LEEAVTRSRLTSRLPQVRKSLPVVGEQEAASSERRQRWSRWPQIAPPVDVPLVMLGAHDCPYLPNRQARDRAFLAENVDPGAYEQLMDTGFRRSGRVVYQPSCRTCRACRPVRVDVDQFKPGKRFRRTLNRNKDITVITGQLEPTPEKFDLYHRYQSRRHGERDHLDWPGFVDFLYDTPVRTREFCYRDDGGKLLAVGICDIGRRSVSSVYFYYDATQTRRSLGTFGALWEIQYAREQRLPHYYLGFWVDGCSAMEYKTHFQPYEILGTDGTWREPADL